MIATVTVISLWDMANFSCSSIIFLVVNLSKALHLSNVLYSDTVNINRP